MQLKQFSKNPHSIYHREKYHSSKKYRLLCIEASAKWIKNNKIRVNVGMKKRYAKLSKKEKEKRLAKIRKMRKLRKWSY